MKMLVVAYNQVLDAEVTEALAALGVTGYTKVPRALGAGSTGGPRLDDEVWPGTNGLLLAVLEPAAADAAFEAMRRLREARRGEGLKAFLLPVEAAT